jgi:hypothetical protein
MQMTIDAVKQRINTMTGGAHLHDKGLHGIMLADEHPWAGITCLHYAN